MKNALSGGGDPAPQPPVTPKISVLDKLMWSIKETSEVTGASVAALYIEFSKGTIQTKKFGKRTLVVAESVREYLRALPDAQFKAPKSK